MANLRLTADNDLDLSSGNLVIIDGPEEIAQKIRGRLQFFLGEWFLDTRLGADHYGVTFRKGVPEIERRQLLLKIVSTCPGVEEVLSFAFVFDSTERNLSLVFRARVSGADEPVDFSEEFIL